MVTKLLREPLVHFVVAALVIFGVYSLRHPGELRSNETITVTSAKMEQLVVLFAKTWQRDPSPEELKGLVDDFVKEEIFYREAVRLGLDKDDTVIRRRLRQKLEFLSASIDFLPPTDEMLLAYLRDHADRYRSEDVYTFEQIAFKSGTASPEAQQRIAEALAKLKAGAAASELGDTTALPAGLAETSASEISKVFGAEFSTALPALAVGEWSGPVASAYFAHVVRVNARRQSKELPTLNMVRDKVLRDYEDDQRKRVDAEFFAELAKRYEIVVEPGTGAAKSVAGQ